MLEFFSANFQGYLWLAIILIAMIPSLESRIALPFAIALSIDNPQITPSIGFICTFLGSILPSLPIIILCKFIKKKSIGFLHDKLTNLLKSRYNKNSETLEGKSKLKKMTMLLLFVALPLPLTGVWSGSIIGGFSNLTTFESFVSITFGSLICCLLMLGICLLFGNSVVYLLISALIIIVLYSAINFIIYLLKKRKEKKNH